MNGSVTDCQSLMQQVDMSQPRTRWAPFVHRLPHIVRLVAVAAGASLLSLSGCYHPRPSSQSAEGEMRWHHWWNYYDRAISEIRESRFTEAAANLERCLGLQAGAVYGMPSDKWRIRTYGVHFLDDYFPNREYGICLHELGRQAEAIRYLETSIHQQPSGRAKHYLNLARQAFMTSQAPAPPDISFTEDSKRPWTRERHRTLAGVARGQGLIRELKIQGRPRFIELAESEMSFVEKVSLSPGTNVIVVLATDLLGRKAENQLVWIADFEPPRLLIQSVRREGTGWRVKGLYSDDQGLQTATVDGVDQLGSKAADYPLWCPIEFQIPAGGTASLAAADRAGNRLSTAVSADELSRSAGVQRPVLYAMNSTPGSRADALPLERPSPPTPSAEAEDRSPPVLTLSPPREFALVAREEYLLEIRARDDGGLASLRLNNQEMLGAAIRGATRAFIPRRLPLSLGTNRFEIAAADASGNRVARTLVVLRKEPEHLSDQYRLTMGVPPLPAPPEQQTLALRAKGMIEKWIANAEPVRFRLLARDDSAWENLLREHQISLSALADPGSALRIGRLLTAELLLVADVRPEGKGITIHARVLDVSTSLVMFVEDVYTEAADDLDWVVSGLVLKVEQRFPLLEGKVLKSGSSRVTLDLGERQGVRPGARFIVVQGAAESSPGLLESVLRISETWVQLEADRITNEACTARVVPEAGAAVVREGDRVYAR